MSSINLASKEALEDMIRSCLVWLPEWVSEYRKKDAKKVWGYEKAEDFVLGLATGMVYAHFEDHFVVINKRDLNPVERKEVMTEILLHVHYIKKVLFGHDAGTGTGKGIK